MSRNRDTDSDRFAKGLLAKGHGYPLWTPEPPDDLPVAYKQEGVRVGDVGVIRSNGSFDFIFNICVPGNHPINRFGVPNGFEQLDIDHSREVYMNENQFPPGADVSSTSIRKTSLELEFSGDGIAASVLLICLQRDTILIVINLQACSRWCRCRNPTHHFLQGRSCFVTASGSLAY